MQAKQLKALKKQAFDLKPVVLLGQKGLTESVLSAIDEALTAHELIKIKLAGLTRDEYAAPIDTILTHCQAELVSRIGRVLTIYRARPEE